jgi:glycosyltransferase involved in cell wall biosynthesis
MLDELRRIYGLDGGVVVPNARRADWVRDIPTDPLILSGGRVWDEAKNLVLVDQIAPDLSWPTIFVGSTDPPGPRLPRPEMADRSLGALSWPELSTWLLRARIYVAPARYEPVGLGILEAAQAGCALVLGDIASLREVWGDAALYADPDDPLSLTASLRDLVDRPELLRQQAQRARKRAAEYSLPRLAASYLDLYARVPQWAGGVA